MRVKWRTWPSRGPGSKGGGSCSLQYHKPGEDVYFAFLSKDLITVVVGAFRGIVYPKTQA